MTTKKRVQSLERAAMGAFSDKMYGALSADELTGLFAVRCLQAGRLDGVDRQLLSDYRALWSDAERLRQLWRSAHLKVRVLLSDVEAALIGWPSIGEMEETLDADVQVWSEWQESAVMRIEQGIRLPANEYYR